MPRRQHPPDDNSDSDDSLLAGDLVFDMDDVESNANTEATDFAVFEGADHVEVAGLARHPDGPVEAAPSQMGESYHSHELQHLEYWLFVYLWRSKVTGTRTQDILQLCFRHIQVVLGIR
ncbi:hypothetical protein ACHAQH_008306 [Verticillium albo-atrum]